MKKIIFECAGNTIFFVLLGLMLLFPVSGSSSGTILDEGGFTATFSVTVMIFIGYTIIYGITRLVLSKKTAWLDKNNSELAFSDEREKSIRNNSAMLGYRVLMFGSIVSVCCIAAAQSFSVITGENISIYALSICLLILTLVITTIAYCIKWCLEYRH